MELKVWVDGIKRVVCGVTDNTTCQDIVIALAQAMGRTGRFTLIEKWRENERPLAPGECPLIVLQKWGEFANEVKLMLYESGTRRKQKHSEKEKRVQKPQETFKHNFTPPVKTSEAVIRRSLTFNGPVCRVENGPYRVQDAQSYPRQSDRNGALGQPDGQFLRVPDNVSDVNAYRSSNSSISSQNSNIPHQQQQHHVRRRSRSSSRDRGGSRDRLQQQPPSYDISAHPHSGTMRGRQPLPSHQNQHQNHQLPQHPPQQSQSYLPNDPQRTVYPPSYNTNSGQGQLHYNQTSSYNKLPSSIPANVQNRPQYPSHHAQHGSNSSSMNGPVPVINGPVKQGQYRPSPVNSNPSPINIPSAFKVVKPRHESPANEKEWENNLRLQNNTDFPVYTDVRKSSHTLNSMEEYDLDSNFPDVVKETGRDFLIEEYHVPGHEDQGRLHGNQKQWEEEERIKLLRLVTMQNERIKMQDSQLDIIDTEIVSREQKMEDLKSEIMRVSEEITKLSSLSEEKDEELSKLDNGTLIDEMESEKATERDIKHEITSLHSRLEKCENDLRQFQSKVHQCSDNLEREQEVLKSDEKRRKEEEMKLQNEILELRKEVDEQSKESEEKSKVYSSVEEELKDISDKLNEKTTELTSTEKELQRENLKFFQHAPKAPLEGESIQQETNGDAVLKVLEGSSSAHVKRAKLLASPLTILELTKHKNGIWV